MSARLRAYIRQHHLALLCLFLIVSGGTAYATHPGGENTISKEDIVDGEVRSAEINNGAVTTDDISNANGVRSADVRDDTLTGGGLGSVDIAPNALTGEDINEATLGKVPDADTLDGRDSTLFRNSPGANNDGECFPSSSSSVIEICNSASTVARTPFDQVYVSVSWRWKGTAVGEDIATCNLVRSKDQKMLASATFGQGGNEHNSDSRAAMGSLVGLDRGGSDSPVNNRFYQLQCFRRTGNVILVGSEIVAIRMS